MIIFGGGGYGVNVYNDVYTYGGTIGGPVITVQPIAQTVYLNQTAAFSVTAAGDGPLSYQWYFNDKAIKGATSATYSVRASATTSGSYKVVVQNSLGSVTSDVVALDAAAARYIWAEGSDSHTVTAGISAGFGVENVTGPTSAVSYQWFKDGVAVRGATGAALNIASVSMADAGRYTLVITTTAGKETTAVRTLAVTDPGLLVYGYGTATASADTTGETTYKGMGWFIVDRVNSQAVIISYGNVGNRKFQTTDGPFPLKTKSTGPRPGSRTAFYASQFAAEPESEYQFWASGVDKLVKLNGTYSTIAPMAATGVVGSVNTVDGVEIENTVQTLALSVSQTLATRVGEETLEDAAARISAELQAKGYQPPAM